MTKIFITGSSGFIGKHLKNELKKRNLSFIAGDRSIYGDMVIQNNWEKLLQGCDYVIHLAARVHVIKETEPNSFGQFRLNNVETTLAIAHAAKKIGVKRLIFLSSVKVNGKETFNSPFRADDMASPKDFYAISKLEAENELLKLHEPGIFEIVIIRPPLVYGVGVKANFGKLFNFINRNIPMPFGLVKNKRSLVSVLNLVDLIIATLTHPKAAGEIFMISDDCDLSLNELVVRIAKVQKKNLYMLQVPVGIMWIGAKIIGKKSDAESLFGNLQVDIEKTKQLLDWKPPYTFEDTFKQSNEF